MALSHLLARRPIRRLGALGSVVGATAVMVGSGANFTAASANPSNVFTAGTLAQSNSKSGSAILTASNMRPGDPAQTGTVDIKNTGSLSGTFTLTQSDLVDTPASPAFSGKLTVLIQDCGVFVGATAPDCTTSPTTKYTGAIGSMGTIALGSYAADEQHRYKFSVTFPDGGANGADNAYQGAETSVTYNWNVVS